MQNQSLDKFANMSGINKKNDDDELDLASILLGDNTEDEGETGKGKNTPPGYEALEQYSNLGKKARGSVLNQLITAAVMRPFIQMMQQMQNPQQLLQNMLSGNQPQQQNPQQQPMQMQTQMQQPVQQPQQAQIQPQQQPVQQQANPLQMLLR